jgi:large subunit ribosomal protein L21
VYAVIRIGGKQYRVQEGETFLVDRQPLEAGESFAPEVLMTAGDGVTTDRAALDGAVSVQVVEHLRGPKLKVFTYRPKKGYSRRLGHRSELSRIRVERVGGAA